MSARPSRSNLLDVLPGHVDHEELSAIHARPTISMPPFPPEPANDVLPSDLLEDDEGDVYDDEVPTEISSRASELLAESELEEAIEEDVTDASDVAVVEDEPVAVAQASLPPSTKKSFVAPAPAPAQASSPKRASTFAFLPMAIAITTLGFVVGFCFTDPPSPSPSPSPAAETNVTASVETASSVVEAPSVLIGPPPAAEPAMAPAVVASAEPSAKKPAAPPSLSDADRALRAGELVRAEGIYESFLARGGADHEALTGLGKIAAARHRTTDALAFFERALARQPEYLPARLGIADALWDGGRTDAAKAKYLEIRAQYSPTTLPSRAFERSR